MHHFKAFSHLTGSSPVGFRSTSPKGPSNHFLYTLGVLSTYFHGTWTLWVPRGRAVAEGASGFGWTLGVAMVAPPTSSTQSAF